MKRLFLKPIMVLSPPKSLHKVQRWISRLHKIRTWTSLSARFKLHKSGGVGGGGGGGSGGGVEYGGDCDQVGGLLNLRDDVQMCGYRDVEVMWNMLSMQPEPVKATAPRTKRGSRRRFLCRLFFRTNRHP